MSLAAAAPPFGEEQHSAGWQNVRPRFNPRPQSRPPPQQEEQRAEQWPASPESSDHPNIQGRTFRPSGFSRGRPGFRGPRGRRSPYTGPDANLPKISEDSERGDQAGARDRGPGFRRFDRGPPGSFPEGPGRQPRDDRQSREDRRDDVLPFRRRVSRGSEDEGRRQGDTRHENEDPSGGRRRDDPDRDGNRREGPGEDGRVEEGARAPIVGRPIRRPSQEWYREREPGVSGFHWADEDRRRRSSGQGFGFPGDHGDGRGPGGGARKRFAGRDPDDFYFRGGKASKMGEAQRQAVPPGFNESEFPTLSKAGPTGTTTSKNDSRPGTATSSKDSSKHDPAQASHADAPKLNWAQESAALAAEEDSKATEQAGHGFSLPLTAAQSSSYSQVVKKRSSSYAPKYSEPPANQRPAQKYLLKRPSRDSPPKRAEDQEEIKMKTPGTLAPPPLLPSEVARERRESEQASPSARAISTTSTDSCVINVDSSYAKPQRESFRLKYQQDQEADAPLGKMGQETETSAPVESTTAHPAPSTAFSYGHGPPGQDIHSHNDLHFATSSHYEDEISCLKRSFQEREDSEALAEVVVDAHHMTDQGACRPLDGTTYHASAKVSDATQTEDYGETLQESSAHPGHAHGDTLVSSPLASTYIHSPPQDSGFGTLMEPPSLESGVEHETIGENGQPEGVPPMPVDHAMPENAVGPLSPPGDGSFMMPGPPMSMPLPWKFPWPSEGNPGSWFYPGHPYPPYCMPPPVFNPGYPFMAPPGQPPMGFFPGYPSYPPPAEAPTFGGHMIPTLPPMIVNNSEGDTSTIENESSPRQSLDFPTPERSEQDIYMEGEPRQRVSSTSEHWSEEEDHRNHEDSRSEDYGDAQRRGHKPAHASHDNERRMLTFQEAEGNHDHRDRSNFDERTFRKEEASRRASHDGNAWTSRGPPSWHRPQGSSNRFASTPGSRRPNSSQQPRGRGQVHPEHSGRPTPQEHRRDKPRAANGHGADYGRGSHYQHQYQPTAHPQWETKPPTILQHSPKLLQQTQAPHESQPDAMALAKSQQQQPSVPVSRAEASTSTDPDAGLAWPRAQSVLHFNNPKFYPEPFQIFLHPGSNLAFAVVTKGNYFHNYLLQTMKGPGEQGFLPKMQAGLAVP